jgi:hypothetical protein
VNDEEGGAVASAAGSGGRSSRNGAGAGNHPHRLPLPKIVFSARLRHRSGCGRQVQQLLMEQCQDTALYTSNVDGTEFYQVQSRPAEIGKNIYIVPNRRANFPC